MTVITTLELDDLVAFGVGACKSQCRHGRFRPRIDEADHLDVGHEIHHTFGKFNFQRTGRAVGRSFHRRLLDGFHDFRVGMSRDERPPREDIVNVAIAVHVEEIGSLAALDEERLSTHSAEGAHGRVHAARE